MRLDTQRKIKTVCAVALPVAVAAMLGAFSGSAEALQLKAKVYLTQEKVPMGLPEKELIAFMQKHQATHLYVSKGSDPQQKTWSANLLIAFNASPGEMEYELTFFDLQKGVRIPLENRSMILSDRVQKTYLQKISLKQPKYQPNREVELVVVIRGTSVGGAKFFLSGEAAAVSTAGASDKPEAKPSK